MILNLNKIKPGQDITPIICWSNCPAKVSLYTCIKYNAKDGYWILSQDCYAHVMKHI